MNNILLKIIIIIIILLIILLINKFNNKQETFNNELIPKVIYLSYKTKKIPDYIIPNWKKLYPDYEVKLYDNNDCIQFLKTEFTDEYVDIFNYIKDGPIKADFWRVCVLYKYGGIYSDIDVEPLVSIEKILENDISFLTCLSAFGQNINPHFIASMPNHKVLKMCIDKYLEMYRNKNKYTYWGWSIVFIMKDSLYNIFGKYNTKEGIYYDEDNYKYQFLKEVIPLKLTDLSYFNLKNLWLKINIKSNDIYCKYNNIKILNNRYKSYVDHSF
jgi:hypothetical protein